MRVLLSLAVAISLISCSNQDILNYCPSTKACIVVDDKVQILEPESPEYTTLNIGACQTGSVACTSENSIICEGFVRPSEDICDGVDNDCNEIIDDGYDLDEDTFTTCGGDCNDNNNTIYPGAPELCDNLDNDCDGHVSSDEADMDTDNYAVCDGDCNDDNPHINPGATEVCNNLDDDCNDLIDDDIPATPCGPESAAGQCLYGENHCIDGELTCVGAEYPQPETCDNVDNNCNGIKDESLYQLCETVCGQGVEICYAGDWYDCTAPEPTEELCDGFDNNCDGQVDEGCPCSDGDARTCLESPMYDINTGQELSSPYPCGEGIQYCDLQGEYGDCFFIRTLEEVCNAWDDDCDGTIDGMHVPCSDYPELAGIGECKAGASYCEMGMYGECIGEVLPEEEFCDGLDNDCDGEVDEELDPHDKVDIVFIVDISGSMQTYIDTLAHALGLYVADFGGTNHRFGLITTGGYGNYGDAYEIRTGVAGNMLVDVGNFTGILSSLQANGVSIELTYDISYMACMPDDPIGINWREDAHPYIILMTDETGQSYAGYTQLDVAMNCLHCSVGDCVNGDIYEFFLITKPIFNQMWINVVDSDPNKIKSILVNDVGSYVDMLKDMFTDICR